MEPSSADRVREGLSTVTRGTLFLLVGTLLFVLLTFAARVIVVRSVSPDEWSAFSWSLTLAGLLSAFGTLGLPSAVARSLPYANSDAERRTMVRGTVLVGGTAGAVVTVALWFLGPVIGTRLDTPLIGVALQFFSIAVGSTIVANLIASIFQGYEDVTPNALFLQVVAPSLFVAFLVLSVLPPAGSEAARASLLAHRFALPLGGVSFRQSLLAYAAANAITLGVVAGYAFVRLRRRLPAGPTAPAAFPRLMRFAAPLFFAGVLGSLTGSGDTIILGLYHPGIVGTYTASLTLARLLQVGIGATAYIFLPVSSRFVRDGDRDSIRTTYVTVTKWMALFSLPLFVLFFFLPSDSLGFVYARYTVVIAPLEITVVGAFLSTLFGPGSATQVAFGQTRLVAYNSLAAAFTDVALALWLVPTLGATGAAIAWASAALVATGLPLAELAVLTGVHPFHSHFVVPLLLTGIPAGVSLYFLAPRIPTWSLPVVGLAIAGLFVLLVAVSRSIDRGDRLLLEVVERMLGRPVPFVRALGRVAFGGRAPD